MDGGDADFQERGRTLHAIATNIPAGRPGCQSGR
jgi:hypothetical protein